MRGATDRSRPEVWAGIECTVNRVGDRYYDQLTRSGSDERPEDADRLAALGVRAVRFPVLWERHELDPGQWARTDDRLARLRAAGVRPVLGLVHHGSGPPHTSLADPGFADGLAAFAARVADRYPWADAYTPVNEPLTTARFTGLYGHWYPHRRTPAAFARCLLNQCRAVVLAMRAVRRVNPRAELIQTDDLGHTHAPPALAYQAEFENARRWLAWDLLGGLVDRAHPLARHLLWAGAARAELDWFRANACPPDVIGVNHYLTSERYLDDRIERYPAARHGGNGKHAYVDVEAVRVLAQGALGPAHVLRQALERYRKPVAVTEVHLGCTRDEQLRWFAEVWGAARDLRAAGADVRAVTAWAAFGAYDWDSLVTLDRGHYEPGAFDVRARPPRPTAVAALVKRVASGHEPDHPVLDAPGWWHRPERFLFPDDRAAGAPTVLHARPVLVVGGSGALGGAFRRVCAWRGLSTVAPTRAELDIADAKSIVTALARYKPWAVVNAAGYRKVDGAEGAVEYCHRLNSYGPAVLATACATARVPLATFSTDLVFDGRAARPYREDDPVGPLSVYGTAKAEADRRVLALHPAALVVRTGAHFGPWDDRNFLARALSALRAGAPVVAADDLTITPAYLPNLVDEVLDLLIDGERGVWHLAPPEAVTWADFARAGARQAGFDPERVSGKSAASLWAAPRPAYSALGTNRGVCLPPLADGLARFVRDFDLPTVGRTPA